jgi:hypothetical protein
MYFVKTLLVIAAVSTSVLGHAAVSPALGVAGKVARKNVCAFLIYLRKTDLAPDRFNDLTRPNPAGKPPCQPSIPPRPSPSAVTLSL